MIPEENRFESDPDDVLPPDPGLPEGWIIDTPHATDRATVERLTELLREHERAGRGWAGSGEDDVLVEISEHGAAMRANVVVRDPAGLIRAWGSVHDRAEGRMLFVHVVDRDLDEHRADQCSALLFEWAEAQARSVGAARGLGEQQIDTGAFAEDERQHRWLTTAGFTQVRTWWQMSRPVLPEDADLVPDPARWELNNVLFRRVGGKGVLPDETDLRAIHDVLEGAFTDHFNHSEETYEEFIHRLREDPGHRWDHWWIAELTDAGAAGDAPQAAGALVGTVSESDTGPDGSYVAYLGVLESARGRGVAKGLLRGIVSDAAERGYDRVGLEVDADSPTGADSLYVGMGWTTKYVTESWHRAVPV